MPCGSCPHTDGLCYASMPPRVRCNITGEYHYYGDECDCRDDIVARKTEELKNIKDLLNRPVNLMAINYDSDNAPAVAITGEEAAIAYASLLNMPLYGEADSTTKITVEPKVATFNEDAEAWKFMAPVEYGSTPCLVCGEDVGIYIMFDNKPKICSSCKKAITFIKERFKEELTNYD